MNDAGRIIVASCNWYGTINGVQVPLCPDKQAAERMLRKLQTDAALGGVGLADPYAAHKRKPLTDHLDDYAEHLKAKGNTPGHVKQSAGRVRSFLIDGCGFTHPPDIDAGRAAEWLNDTRRPGQPVELPSGESFTPAQVPVLLGVSGAAVRSAVKRMGLSAVGHGKARRYPRATVKALTVRGRGVAPETANHYIRAVRGFMRWMVRAKRIGANPLDTLSLLNTRADVRRARRELAADELRTLLDVTRRSNRRFRGLTGEDRFHLYLTAATTGFRATALANLTPADFDLTDDAPTVTLPARFNKSRKLKVQPIPSDVAARLRA